MDGRQPDFRLALLPRVPWYVPRSYLGPWILRHMSLAAEPLSLLKVFRRFQKSLASIAWFLWIHLPLCPLKCCGYPLFTMWGAFFLEFKHTYLHPSRKKMSFFRMTVLCCNPGKAFEPCLAGSHIPLRQTNFRDLLSFS